MFADKPRPVVRGFVLCLLGLVLLAGYASTHVFALLDPPFVLRQLALQLGLYGVYLTAAWLSRDLERGPLLYGLLLLGLLQALCLVPLGPSLSDDLFRYIWDGRVQAHGINPFLYPPSSEQLSWLVEPRFHPFINHPDYRTVYPPVAQLMFWLGWQLTPGSFVGFKLVLLACHGLTVGLLGLWLWRRELPMGRLLWVAWCPLLLFELMLDGHVDGLALPWLVGLLWAARGGRPILAGLCLALALLVKPLPLFLLPLLAWKLRWRAAVRMLVACGVAVFLLYLPYLSAGEALFRSLLAYSRHWSFNGPLFSLLDLWLLPSASRLILLSVIALVSVAVAFAPLPGLRWEQRALIPLATYMLCATTLYPWYLVWLVPWLVFSPRPWLFWWVGAISGAHYVLLPYMHVGAWHLPPEILGMEFGPLALLLGMDLFRYWQRHRGKSEKQQLREQVEELRARVRALEQR